MIEKLKTLTNSIEQKEQLQTKANEISDRFVFFSFKKKFY